MFSLKDLLGSELGGGAVDQISQNLGSNPQLVNSAIQMALPMILGGLTKNASTPEGAQSLDNALATDHQGGLMGNLTDFLTGGIPSPEQATRETNGSGILGHILGASQGTATQEISNKTGMSMGQTANLLITLAPIVMSFLGKKKQQGGLNAGGITDLLTGQQQQMQSSGNPIMDIASSVLDRDGDGSALDDLASMAASYFMK